MPSRTAWNTRYRKTGEVLQRPAGFLLLYGKTKGFYPRCLLLFSRRCTPAAPPRPPEHTRAIARKALCMVISWGPSRSAAAAINPNRHSHMAIPPRIPGSRLSRASSKPPKAAPAQLHSMETGSANWGEASVFSITAAAAHSSPPHKAALPSRLTTSAAAHPPANAFFCCAAGPAFLRFAFPSAIKQQHPRASILVSWYARGYII